MIAVSDIKAFLNITTTDKDSFFETCRIDAISQANSFCNRKLDYQLLTEYYNGNGKDIIYLDNFPVESVSSIEYYDTTTETFITLFDTGDSVADIFLDETQGKIKLKKGYTFPEGENNIRIVYYAGYKATKTSYTISNIASRITAATVTIGAHSLLSGTIVEMVNVSGFQNNPIGNYVISNVSGTGFDITIALGTGTFSSGTAITNNNLYNSTPDDLKLALIYLASEIYFNSPVCDSPRLGITSKNFNAGSSGGVTYEDIGKKVNGILNSYKRILI